MKQDVSCALYAFRFLNVGLKVVRENPGFEERVSGEAEPVPMGREAQGLSPVGSAGCPQPGSGLSSPGQWPLLCHSQRDPELSLQNALLEGALPPVITVLNNFFNFWKPKA